MIENKIYETMNGNVEAQFFSDKIILVARKSENILAMPRFESLEILGSSCRANESIIALENFVFSRVNYLGKIIYVGQKSGGEVILDPKNLGLTCEVLYASPIAKTRNLRKLTH